MNDNFDYNQVAELHLGHSGPRDGSPASISFPSAAEAVQFAIEDLPRELLCEATLKLQDERLREEAILALYMAFSYPLKRGR